MIDAMMQVLPLLLIFLLGYGLKRIGALSADDGSSLLKLIFYAGAPAIIFLSFLRVDLDASMLWLCLLAPVVASVALAAVAILRISLLRDLNMRTFGSLLAGSVIINTGFMLPFVEELYGAEGLARFAVIDAFNTFVTFGLVYAAVVRVSNDRPDYGFVARKLLKSPPIWALVLAIILKITGVLPPVAIDAGLEMVARIVGPIILIALGLKFSMHVKRPGLIAVPLLLRFGLGVVVGMIFVKLTGLEGLSAQVAVLVSAAPIGFNSITFAELEKLDVPFAASQVSVAMVAALVTTPLVVWFVSGL